MSRKVLINKNDIQVVESDIRFLMSKCEEMLEFLESVKKYEDIKTTDENPLFKEYNDFVKKFEEFGDDRTYLDWNQIGVFMMLDDNETYEYLMSVFNITE